MYGEKSTVAVGEEFCLDQWKTLAFIPLSLAKKHPAVCALLYLLNISFFDYNELEKNPKTNVKIVRSTLKYKTNE